MITHPPGSTGTAGTAGARHSVAVVGSGPAGFYTVEALIKQGEQAGLEVEIDLFERLPAPYGLVRYGVAPDHQKIKSVTTAYDKLGAHGSVRFLGNVNVGADISVEELARNYDQVVFAVGCGTDRHLGVPGEDLAGSHAATSFVAWYNGHPDFLDYHVDLDTESAVIVGIGDVAMDLTRMLLRDVDDLAKTDVAEHAIDVFRRSRVREVILLARRGPAQAAFATKELEDIAELPSIDVCVDANHVRADMEDAAQLDGLARRKLEYLARLAGSSASERDPSRKRVVFRFLTSPMRIVGASNRVAGVEVEHNAIVRDADGRASAKGTGNTETIPAGLVFRSVGYRGLPIPGLPFDERQGIVPNQEGRVLAGGEVRPGMYVSGWIKRGPSGVIGTNKSDAAATVHKMLEDRTIGGSHEPRAGRLATDALLRGRSVRVIDWGDWKRLDALEKERGVSGGKVRSKFVRVSDVLAALDP